MSVELVEDKAERLAAIRSRIAAVPEGTGKCTDDVRWLLGHVASLEDDISRLDDRLAQMVAAEAEQLAESDMTETEFDRIWARATPAVIVSPDESTPIFAALATEYDGRLW